MHAYIHTYVTETTRDGSELEVVDDFKYLSVSSKERDLEICKAQAWSALHSMKILWGSDPDDYLKRQLFVATVEPALLYGAEAWSLTVQQEKSLDGAYTRMLRTALNVNWEDHIHNVDLYGDLPRISTRFRKEERS